MTGARRERILRALRDGHMIFRSWKGSDRSGRLRNSLEGVNRLLNPEVDQLVRERVVEVSPTYPDGSRAIGPFKPLRLRRES